MEQRDPGTIITFYSYKGGTGRSMAMANVAWILASHGKSVLMLDWDLEAPGLHRYFAPFLFDKELTSSDGIIDFVTNFATEAMTPLGPATGSDKPIVLDPNWYEALAKSFHKKYTVAINYDFPDGGTLHLAPAGHQGPAYATRVNLFNWQKFYERLSGGVLLHATAQHLRKHFEYILIDSRTGVSDTSGICTVQLPDMLVVCFTANNQGIDGAAGITESVCKQWKETRPNQVAQIFPLITRIDTSEKDKLQRRFEYAQLKFNPFLERFSVSEQEAYWSTMQAPYIPWYGYEEVLATFGDKLPLSTTSLLGSMLRITSYITGGKINALKPENLPSEETRLEKLALFAGDQELAAKIAQAKALGPQFDVLLAHCTAESSVVDGVANRLKSSGLKPRFSVWKTPANGVGNEAELAALANSSACALCIGPHGGGPWLDSLWQALSARMESHPAYRLIPIFLPGSERADQDQLPEPLRGHAWIDLRSLDDAEAMLRLTTRIRGVGPDARISIIGQDGQVPYRGFEAFEEQHARFFFGRENLLQALLKPLDKPQGSGWFTAIVGPSGSGKSSFVRAGVLPAVRDGKLSGSRDWQIKVLRPGKRPIENLAEAVSGLVSGPGITGGPVDVPQWLRGSQLALVDVVRAYQRSANDSWRLVLVVDQFDELFHTTMTDIERRAFIDNLVMAAKSPEARVWIVVTMRLDTTPWLVNYPELAALIKNYQLICGGLEEHELRAAIEKPAQIAGGEFEIGLVDRLVSDVQGQPGGLALLEHALLDLWQRRSEGRMTAAEYKKTGALSGGILRRADEVVQSLTDAERETCRQIFLRLASPGETTEDIPGKAKLQDLVAIDEPQAKTLLEAAEKRARATASNHPRVPFPVLLREVGNEWFRQSFPLRKEKEAPSTAAETPAASQLQPNAAAPLAVIRKLTDARLLTTRAGRAQPTDVVIEPSHNDLILRWPTFRTWIDADRGGLRTRDRLSQASQLWSSHGRDDGDLFAGPRLTATAEWATAHVNDINSLESEFITASLRADEKFQKSRGRANQLRDALIGSYVVLIMYSLAALVFIVLTFSFVPRYNSTKRDLAVANKSIEDAKRELGEAKQIAASAKGEAIKSELAKERAEKEALRTKAEAEEAIKLTKKRAQQELQIEKLVQQSNGISVGNSQRSILLAAEALKLSQDLDPWAYSAESQLRDILHRCGGLGLSAPNSHFTSTAVYGSRLAMGSADGVVRIWDFNQLNTLEPLTVQGAHTGPVTAIDLNDVYLATGSKDGSVRLWDLKLLFADAPRAIRNPRQTSIERPRHQLFLTSALVDDQPTSRSLVRAFRGHEGNVVQVSLNGEYVVTLDEAGTLRRWKLNASDRSTSEAQVLATKPVIKFVGRRKWLALQMKENGTVQLFDQAKESQLEPTFELPCKNVSRIVLSHTERWLATSDSKQIQVWDLSSGVSRSKDAYISLPSTETKELVFAHSEQWLATTNEINGLRLLDLSSNSPQVKELWRFADKVALLDDAKFAIASYISLRIHDLGIDPFAEPNSSPINSSKLTTLYGPAANIDALFLSTTAPWLAAIYADGTANLWRTKPLVDAALPVQRANLASSCSAFAVGPNNTLLLGLEDGSVQQWQLSFEEPYQQPVTIETGKLPVRGVALSQRWRVTLDAEQLRLWDRELPMASPLKWDAGLIRVFALSADRWLTTGSDGGALVVLRLPAKQDDKPMSFHVHKAPIASIRYSADQRWLITSDTTGFVFAWDLDVATPIAVPLHYENVRWFDTITVSGTLVAGGNSDLIAVWDLAVPNFLERVRILNRPTSPNTSELAKLMSLSFGLDGRSVFGVYADGLVMGWSFGDGNRPITFAPPNFDRANATFSPSFAQIFPVDQNRIMVVQIDGFVELRSLVSPASRSVKVWNSYGNGRVAISNDRKWGVSVIGSEAEVWPLTTDTLLEVARRTSGRNLTPVEWQQYFEDQPYREIFPGLPIPRLQSDLPPPLRISDPQAARRNIGSWRGSYSL